ncbi:hypothetical protein [Magnetococcus sp. PR-3]|uniref:hypothetical protein n=1 Tax=Magnetococcus sp. PR-3 TaxID=3120355 RepID=UPI002FCE2A4D
MLQDSIPYTPYQGNAIDPDLLTIEERLDEIAEILANGVLRLMEKKNLRTSLKKQQKPLDSVSEQSVHGDQGIPQKQGDEHHEQ